MNRIHELETLIAAFGRPRPLAPLGSTERDEGTTSAGSRLRRIALNAAAAKAWDAEDPERARRFHALVAELDAETKRVERTERERIATERILRTSASRLERSGVGERSLDAAASAYETEALGVVKRWRADASLTWLVMCGVKGTGKSVAATWLVREVINSGDSAAFRRTSELAKLSQFEAGAAELEHLKCVHLLVLDDFGAELLTDYARAQLFEVLDHRHENYGRTILTSNLQWQGAGGMAERLGERLVDRMAQAGRVVQLQPEKSLRRGGRSA